MPHPPPTGLVAIDVPLRPDELAAAWRPDSRRLLLPSRVQLRPRQRVAARISAVGLRVAATITGHVASSSTDGDRFRVEVVPDEGRVRAVDWLLSVARGEAADPKPRAPRFLATMPAVVYGPGGLTYMNTLSVSEMGCGLAWSGPVPAVGVPMDVRIGAGARTAAFRGVVCSITRSGRAASVGVRFLAGARSAWATMLADVKLSGAPPA